MRSSIVTTMFIFWNYTQLGTRNIICCFQTTLPRLFHPLVVYIKGTTMSYPQPKLSRQRIPIECIKSCQIVQKHPETVQVAV